MNKTHPTKPKRPTFDPKSLCHGGDLRKTRKGRGRRPLSKKRAHHIVFKTIKNNLRNKSLRHPRNFLFVQKTMKKYAKKFFVKIEKISYQHDHIHICARSGRSSNFHNFFRVFAGQIAQNLKVTDTPQNLQPATINLWKERPYTRIVIGWVEYRGLENYIQLNEKEVLGKIPYQKNRTRNLSVKLWKILWS